MNAGRRGMFLPQRRRGSHRWRRRKPPMRARAEALKAAGNVLLRPIELGDIEGKNSWRRALLVGSRDEAALSAATSVLRQAAPILSVQVWGRSDCEARGFSDLRRQRYDVVCLLLTGERLRREKVLGLLSGARVLLARGGNGRWYRIELPPLRPTRLQWWARLVLSALLCGAYLRVWVMISAVDMLRRLFPAGRRVSDTGRPSGHQVTFIVPNYNQRHLMDFCLPPLLAEAGNEHTVILVDDASTDGSASYVRTRYPQVRVVRLPRNRGFSGAVRAGIAACETPLFALINTDVQTRPGFLQAMLPHFGEAATFAVCSRIELPGGSQMETGNVAPAFSGILEPYHVPPTQTGPILYAGGASSIYHRARYHAIGGFETMYRPLYFEDIELGYRAWRRGWQSVFEPSASVWHQRRAWMGKRFGDAYANETFLKNALLFVWKNIRDRGLLAQHFAYVWARLVSEVLRGEGMMCRAVLRALPLAPWVMMKRWREHRRGDVSDRAILQMARPPSADEFVETTVR